MTADVAAPSPETTSAHTNSTSPSVSQPTVFEAALAWHDAGYCVRPIRLDGTKRPVGDWKCYQFAGPTRAQLLTDFGGGHPGVGLICGAISGGLEMFELEGRAVTIDALKALADELERTAFGGMWQWLVRDGYAETTPSGGIHLLYRITDHEVPGNTVIAKRPAREAELNAAELAIRAKKPRTVFTRVLAETRGEGGCVTVAPSHGPVHPTGEPWELMFDSKPGVVLELTWAERQALHAAARTALHQMPAKAAPKKPAPAAKPSPGELRPGDDWARQTSWRELLEPYGHVLEYSQDTEDFWRRSGKDTGVSFRTGGTFDGLYCWSTSTDFPAEQNITKFQAYAWLEHGGDLSAAASALAAQGFGSGNRDPDWVREKGEENLAAIAAAQPVGGTNLVDNVHEVQPGDGDGASDTEDDEDSGEATWKGALSDARLAESVSDAVLADRFCWTGALGWLQWTGQRWQRCEEPDVVEVVRRHFVEMFVRAVKNGMGGDRFKAMQALLSSSRIAAVTRLTKGIVRRDAADFDQRPDLLNTPTSVVDLTTGALLPHDPAYLMTKLTGVGYDPAAAHADWDKALEAVPANVRGWYQVRLGQAITGHTPPDDVLVVQQGGGENGKTTVTNTIAKAIGDYFVLVSDRVLLAEPGAHPTEVMELRGARLAVVEETPEERRLSVARLKKIVGTPLIEARYIRQNSVTFRATHSLFVSTNYRPMVSESDRGTWRRLLLVRFPYTFVKPEEQVTGPDDRWGDPTLRDRLPHDERALQAALRWLVDGARCWYANGRIMPPPPAEVLADTRAWRSESDQILAYIGECLVFDAGRHVIATELLDDFNTWLLAHGHKVWSDKTLASRFGDHAEVTAHRVTKEKLPRVGGGVVSRLARTNWLTPPPRYMGWTGVRFTEPGDKAAELG